MSCEGVMTCYHFRDMDRDINQLKNEANDFRNKDQELNNRIEQVTTQDIALAGAVAELRSELAEFKELFHKFSDAAMKNDAKHENIIAELHDQIHELQSHCSGGGSGLHEDM